MPDDSTDLAALEQERSRLHAALEAVGDFRRGSLSEVRRKCGKPNCACAAPDHPGHGPQYNLTRSVAGKTANVHLKPGPELDKARREVASYKRFQSTVAEIVEVNEAICDARPALAAADGPQALTGAEKGGSSPTSRRRSPPR
jgi:hypothetical protein